MTLDDQFEKLLGFVQGDDMDGALDYTADLTDPVVRNARSLRDTSYITTWLCYWNPKRLIAIGSQVAHALISYTKGARCEAWDALAERVIAVYPQHSDYIQALLLETPHLDTKKTPGNPFLAALNKGREMKTSMEDKRRSDHESRLETEVPLAREWIERCLPERITERTRFDIEGGIPLQGFLYVDKQGVSAEAVAYAINKHYSSYLSCTYVSGKDRYEVTVIEAT